mmetsp:Transcript_76009/g.154039  ORF Transcript_76009/g.154039 Transcript_76009/m.154039 type:complete len:90 (+) Transcript_76009:103-372(+)
MSCHESFAARMKLFENQYVSFPTTWVPHGIALHALSLCCPTRVLVTWRLHKRTALISMTIAHGHFTVYGTLPCSYSCCSFLLAYQEGST